MDLSPLMHYAVANMIVTLGFVFGFPVPGLVLAVAALFGKEYHDKKRGGPFDWKDIVVGILGACAPFIIR